MDLRQLRYFVAIADLSSLTAAAEHLGVTQPALGQQMRNLEMDLDTKLIERHSRGVALTEAGRLLRTHALEILDRTKRAEQDIRRFSRSPFGTVRVGVTPSLGRVLVPPLLEACADRHPDINLSFVQGFTDQLDRLVTSKALDLAVTHAEFDTETLETVPLHIETMCLVGTHELLSGLQEPVPLPIFVKLPLVLDERSQQVQKILESGIRAQQLEYADSVEIAAINIRREFVVQNKRCSVAPPALFSTEIEAGELIALKIDLPDLKRTLHLASARVEAMTPAEAIIRSLIIELMDGHIKAGRYGLEMPVS